MTTTNADGAGVPDTTAAWPAETLAQLRADAAQVIARYPQARSALLPLLHLVQSEEGYVSPDGASSSAPRPST